MNERSSARLARKFIENGFSKVYVLEGGWRKWRADDFPVEKK
jgi:rhodanese-related sulfurtransferase